jgi:hypothetical protein
LPDDDPDAGVYVLVTPEGPLYPFTRAVRHAWSPLGYLVTGRTDRYSFDVLRPGDPVRVHRPATPVPLTSGERRDWNRMLAYVRVRTGNNALPSTAPATKPAYRELDVDDEGRIWVDRYVAADPVPPPASARERGMPDLGWRERRTFDVFAPEGEYLLTVVIPRNIRVLVRRGDRLWGVQRDDLGVQYVVRYRLTSRE